MKTVIVTGANSGLGLWTTKQLLDKGYSVIMACRDIEKTQKAIDEFSEFDQSKVFIIKKLDLADFDSIRNFVASISDIKDIYALDCNAGISYVGPFRYTKNGIEETFGTNYLGHFLLTQLLLEKYNLERIVFISSGLHDPKSKAPFAPAVFRPINDLAYPKVNSETTQKKQCEEFYANSKLCMILFSYELDRRRKQKNAPKNILINAVNRGLMLTTNFGRTYKFGEHIYRTLLDLFFKLIGLSDNPKKSASVVVKLIDEITTSGKYYEKGKPIPSSVDSYDTEKAIELWEGSEKINWLNIYSQMKYQFIKQWLTMPKLFLPIIILVLLMTTTHNQAQTLQTVPHVDLTKYAGKWYEIASYPQRFQKVCHCTTAEYTLSDKGYVIVENRCNKDSVNGKESYIKGKAFVEAGSGNAKLKVQFFWPFKGKYWIIDLADDYSYAVVSHPDKKYLWILSRTAKMDKNVYEQILSRLKEKGFDLTKLQKLSNCNTNKLYT